MRRGKLSRQSTVYPPGKEMSPLGSARTILFGEVEGLRFFQAVCRRVSLPLLSFRCCPSDNGHRDTRNGTFEGFAFHVVRLLMNHNGAPHNGVRTLT